MPATDGVIAVDLGTSRAKVGVFDLTGVLRAGAAHAYPLIEGPGPDWFEQDADEWWRAVRAGIVEAAGRAAGIRIVGICIGGQGPSPVPVDAAGRPLAHALIWKDRRAEAERVSIGMRLGREVTPFSSVPKALWLRRNRPDVWARTAWFLQAWDSIAFRLTGTPVSSTFGGGAVFPDDLVDAAELERARFPRQIGMGERSGALTAAAAAELGLTAGIPVAGGVNDSTASVIGAAVLARGLAIDFGGSSGGLGLCWDRALVATGIWSWPTVVPGLYSCGGPLAAAGRSFEWLLRVAGYAGDEAAALREAEAIPAGADGLVFLPYLAGERAPLWDDRVRGVLYGITERHTRGHVARAVLEGVAFALRHVADVLRDAGGRIDVLRATGGQARSPLWNRIKADVLGCAVEVPRVTDAALLGDAILAALAAGRISDLTAGARDLVRIASRLEPDARAAPAYDGAYRTYRELSRRTRDLTAPA